MDSARETSLQRRPNALRLGLCCQFAGEPIKFRTTTVTAMLRLPRPVRLEWLGWPLTVEVEAKAKELAVAKLIADIKREGGFYAC